MIVMLAEIIHKQHLQLKEMFSCHQELLLQGDLNEAFSLLEKYAFYQKAHIQIEEESIFIEFTKIYRETLWDLSLYKKEHKNIIKLYKNIAEDLNWLRHQSMDASQKYRKIIAIIDKEKTLKGLNEHHEAREIEAMIKELDEKLTQDKSRNIAHHINSVWNKLK